MATPVRVARVIYYSSFFSSSREEALFLTPLTRTLSNRCSGFFFKYPPTFLGVGLKYEKGQFREGMYQNQNYGYSQSNESSCEVFCEQCASWICANYSDEKYFLNINSHIMSSTRVNVCYYINCNYSNRTNILKYVKIIII